MVAEALIACLISHDFAGMAASVIYMIVYQLVSTLMFAWIITHLLRISGISVVEDAHNGEIGSLITQMARVNRS